MRYELATNKQLETIIKFDFDCPRSLLSGIVEEMINRGLFDRIIKSCTRKIIKDVQMFEQVYHIGLDDFLQMGRIAILKAVEKFEPSKGMCFQTFAYLKIQTMIGHEIQFVKAEKRNSEETSSYNQVTDAGTEMIEFFVDPKTNVEKYVINKLTVKEMLKSVNKRQQKVLLYRLQGYEFKEIAKLMGVGSNLTMSQSYRLAIKKMRKEA